MTTLLTMLLLAVPPASPAPPPRVEGEKLAVLDLPGGTRIEPQGWVGTGDGQLLWWHDRPAVGDTLKLGFDLPPGTPPGPRRVWARFLHAPDYGTFDFDVNGQTGAAGVNLYAPQATPAAPVDLGVFDLKAGGNELAVRVRTPDAAADPLGRMMGLDYLAFTDPDAGSAAAAALVSAGDFTNIYDPGVGESGPWYINDHCFVQGDGGAWSLFGITREEPARAWDEDNFAHATSPTLLDVPWQKRPFVLTTDPAAGEAHLWAPHVVEHGGTYYMFYCAGAVDAAGKIDSRNYRIHLATSRDLKTWTRSDANPLFTDGYDARDPMVLRAGDKWVMYYTANAKRGGGNHVVAARTSDDLTHWGERQIVFTSQSKGTSGGPTESPFVVRRGDWYYLFVGPRGGYAGQYGYVGTDVYRSRDPMHFDAPDHVGFIDAHAPEVVRDADGKWYISHCGWGQGGVFLAPLTWHDGLDDAPADPPAAR